MKKHKQTIIIFLLILIFLGMAIGYSVLQTKLNITGTSQIIGNFDVFISNVAEAKVEGAKTKSTSVDDPLAASFEVSLEKPGSYAIYNVTVKNNGNLDAELTQIDGLQQESDFTFTVENLSEQDLLLAGAEKIFQVRIGWDPDSTTIPKGQVKLQLKLSYTQVSLGDREVDITPPTANPTIQENGTNYLVVQSGCEDSQSSIRYVEYQVNEQEWAPGEQTEKLENLKSGEYHIKVKCTNSNGLEVISNEISASTKELETPQITIPSDWQVSKDVTIKYQDGQNNFIYKYKINGGDWTSTKNATTTVSFNTTGTIQAEISDGINTKTTASTSVDKIDSGKPTAPTIALSNNNSDIIISQESESLSGIKHYQYYVDKNNTPQEQWSWIDLGANVKTVKNSNDIECNNIYFRAVNNAGTYGEISSALFIERIPSSSGVTARCTASGLRPE